MKNLFGTDGIRGIANQFPVSADLVLKLGFVLGGYFKSIHKSTKKVTIIIAKDTRLSGYIIESALSAGFLSAGCDVVLVGPMPTPAVSILIKSLRADAGIMITASHNPYNYNGIKTFKMDGTKLTEAEEEMITQKVLEKDITSYLVQTDDLGKGYRLDDVLGRYIETIKSTFEQKYDLSNYNIVVDCANGSGYKVAPSILWELGANVHAIHNNPNGRNINMQCGSMHPALMQKEVLKQNADIGLALDGDADRILVCDENGQIISGMHLLAAIALEMLHNGTLKNNVVVTTEVANTAFDNFLADHGIKVIRTKVGDKNVTEAMLAHGSNLGGEPSGHIIIGDLCASSDAMAAFLKLVEFLQRQKMRTSDVHSLFESFPQIKENIEYINIDPLQNKAVQQELQDITEQFPNLKIIVRKSGTEKIIRTMIEGTQGATNAALAIRKLIVSHSNI